MLLGENRGNWYHLDSFILRIAIMGINFLGVLYITLSLYAALNNYLFREIKIRIMS